MMTTTPDSVEAALVRYQDGDEDAASLIEFLVEHSDGQAQTIAALRSALDGQLDDLTNVLRGAISISRASPYWNADMREGCAALVENICCHYDLDRAALSQENDDE